MNNKIIKLLSLRDTYHWGIAVLGPAPVSGQWIAMAHTDQHTFVLLIAMLRVLVGNNVGKRYSRRETLKDI